MAMTLVMTMMLFLGINPNSSSRNEATSIAQLKARLQGVYYIFIDEVSMLSCHDLYKISAKLAKAMNVFDLPFVGISITFAGDFAQLPPVGGAALYMYSGVVGTQVHSGSTLHAQEAAIGKALWHQVTTVVILGENMRQKTQTADDALFHTALVNMRYGECTQEDIRFLRSRIAGNHPDQPNVASKNFRNVPIIRGIHSQKDQINLLGCERFASDTDQRLTNFYSIDKWGKERKYVGKSKVKTKHAVLHETSDIDPDIQVRDNWRNVLHTIDPVMFPRGKHGISVASLAEEMLKVTDSIASSQHQCSRCEYAENPIDDMLTYVLHADNSTKHSTNTWVNGLSQITHRRCPDCNHSMKQVIFYNEIPNIVILEYPMKNIQTSHSLEFMTDEGEIKILNLRGIVYHGGYHFTSCIVSSEQKIWYHDGINTGKLCFRDGILRSQSEDRLRVCQGRNLVLAVYAQKL